MECCSTHLCIFAQFISHDPLACFPFSRLLNKNCALRYFLTPVLPKWACFNWRQWWFEESPVVNKPTLQISFFSFFGKVIVTALQTLPTELVVLSAMSVLVSRLSTQHLESSGKARLPDTRRLPNLLYFLVINQYHSFLTLLLGLYAPLVFSVFPQPS